MKRFTLETLGCIAFILGLILVVGTQFTGCQADPIPESQARLSVEQNRLPVEQNFHQANEVNQNAIQIPTTGR